MPSLNDLAGTPLWQRMLDELAAQLSTHVYAVDTLGVKVAGSGKQPLFCQLQERTGKCLECRQHWTEANGEAAVVRCHANLLNLIAPLELNTRRLGTLVASAMVTDLKDIPNEGTSELRDAAGELRLHAKDDTARRLATLRFFARMLPELCAAELERQRETRELGLLLEYADLANGSPTLERLMQSTATFLAQKLKLSNCAVLYTGRQHRMYPGGAPAVEDIALKSLRSTRATLSAAKPKNDFLLKGAADVNAIEGAFAAVPILADKEFAGAFFLYRERDLRDELGMLLRIGASFTQAAGRIGQLQQAQASAVTDPLTGLYNRALFTEALRSELYRAAQDAKPTSLILFDVDNFKHFNDTHGHIAGDQVLRQVAEHARNSLRSQDSVYRYGGEEFVAVLPGTGPDQASAAAERVRSSIEEHAKLTVSVGLVTCLNSSAAPMTMLEEADKALYRAKASGKNRVIPFIIVDRSLGTVDVEKAMEIGTKER